MQTKIEKYGLENFIIEATTKRDKNPNDIARELQEQGYDISHMTVRRWLDKHKFDLESLAHDSHIITKVVNHTFSMSEQFLLANQQTFKILQLALQSGELPIALKAIERIERQIILHKDLFGVTEGDLDFTRYYESFPPELRVQVKALVEKHLESTS